MTPSQARDLAARLRHMLVESTPGSFETICYRESDTILAALDAAGREPVSGLMQRLRVGAEAMREGRPFDAEALFDDITAAADLASREPESGDKLVTELRVAAEWLRDEHGAYAEADTLTAAADRIAEMGRADRKMVAKEPTEAQVEAIRRAMSPEKFVSHMRAIDCWVEGWLAAEPRMPSELALVSDATLKDQPK